MMSAPTRAVVLGTVCVALLLSGCSASSSPRSGLAQITDDQKQLQALDAKAAQLPAASVNAAHAAAATADDLASSYEGLEAKAESQRPTDAHGDEQTVWDSFIGILKLRAQAARSFADGAAARDMSAFRSQLGGWNRQTRQLNDQFNTALAHIRGVSPPNG